MKTAPKIIFWWLILVMVCAAGCETAPTASKPEPVADSSEATVITNRLDPALLRPPTDMFVLGPGDRVEVELPDNVLSRAEEVVGLDGKLYYSVLPGIDVWGLTLPQARTALEKEMGKYLSDPRLVLSLKSVGSKYVWLLGRLNKPGIYPLPGSVTLLEALAMAGGTGQSASTVTTQDIGDLSHSFVMRDGKLLPVDFTALLQSGDMTQNIYVKPNDFVYIPSALSVEIYVLGAVTAPHAIPYASRMSVVSALAGAGGTTTEAYLTHVAIVRGSLSKPRIIQVDYKAILRGKAPNVQLEPGDIVYVPLSPYRFISEYADVIVTTFARTWSANEGIRAVNGNTAVGINVPIGVH